MNCNPLQTSPHHILLSHRPIPCRNNRVGAARRDLFYRLDSHIDFRLPLPFMHNLIHR